MLKVYSRESSTLILLVSLNVSPPCYLAPSSGSLGSTMDDGAGELENRVPFTAVKISFLHRYPYLKIAGTKHS